MLKKTKTVMFREDTVESAQAHTTREFKPQQSFDSDYVGKI